MKTIKRIVCIALALMMLFAAVSCKKNPSDVMKLATAKSVAANGYHVDGEYKITMSADGTTVPMVIKINEDCTVVPLTAKVGTIMDMGDLGSMEMTVYVESADDEYTVYTGVDLFGESFWQKQSATLEETAEITSNLMAESAEMYNSIEFTEVGQEERGGVKTTHYTGAMTGEYVGKALEASGMDKQFEELGLTGDFLDGLNNIESGIKLDIWVSDDYYIIGIDMDMSDVMAEVISTLVSALAEEADELELDISEAVLSMTYSNYGKVDPIVVPEEVKQQATEVDY